VADKNWELLQRQNKRCRSRRLSREPPPSKLSHSQQTAQWRAERAARGLGYRGLDCGASSGIATRRTGLGEG